MGIKAICTWGEAEDVTIVGKHSNSWADRMKTGLVMLFASPLMSVFPDRPKGPGFPSIWPHGYSHDWQLSMNQAEARSLAVQLFIAANQCDEMEQGLIEWSEKHQQCPDCDDVVCVCKCEEF